MNVTIFSKYEFFTGVPDSQLKSLMDWLYITNGTSTQHIVAANEGNAVAIAAGYYLATGKTPVVYMQNSGIGNIINPVLSLTHPRIYGIPMLFVVGWRGEPDVRDEPQHIVQGELTIELLKSIGITPYILENGTTDEQFQSIENEYESNLSKGESVALIVRKGALEYDGKAHFGNGNTLMREDAIREIINHSANDKVFSTTGKASRELFELRRSLGHGHDKDFLTVGSMGHCSSLALGYALQNPEQRAWIIDGDGAVLMHLGAMAVIGAQRCKNLIHIVINNAAHESVGGMPTVAGKIDLCRTAGSFGYENLCSASDISALGKSLHEICSKQGLSFVEVNTSVGSRADLGRPDISPAQNKKLFMERNST